MKTLLVWLVCTTSALSADYLSVKVPNADPGVCFWACADSVLRSAGKESNLKRTVLLTGIGRDHGADMLAIYLLTTAQGNKLGFVPPSKLWNHPKQVIVTMQPWNTPTNAHAIVLINCYSTQVGRRQYAHFATYYDPNHPDTYHVMSWSKFRQLAKYGYTIE